MLVRFAPARAEVTSKEALVFQTNTSAGVEKVTLTGLSQTQPVIEGPIGPAGTEGPQGRLAPQGARRPERGPHGPDRARKARRVRPVPRVPPYTGPKGAPGRDATVRCEVGGKGAKGVKVTCKVIYGGKASRAEERKLSGHAATLRRGGKVYAAAPSATCCPDARSRRAPTRCRYVRAPAVTRFKIRLG